MKIAFVVHDYHREGGHSRYVAELAERFSREHEVHVFTNRFDDAGNPAIHFHRVPAWRGTALSTILTFLLPATAALGSDFDIIHTQGLCCFRFNVITAHVCGRAWHRARRGGGAARWKDYLFNCLVNPLEKLVFRRWKRASVIAISDRVRRDLRECYGRNRNVTVIRHGVDLAHFHPALRQQYRGPLRAELGWADSDVVTLYVGDLRKGAVPALRAAAAVDGVKPVFVSRSDPAPYRKLAGELGLGDRAVFCPATRQIRNYYAAADCFLFPSSYDAFGMVVTEAMACGLPVITSRATGAAELIENGSSGLLVKDAYDSVEIAGCLRRLVEDAALRQRMGAAARRAVEQHSWEAVADKTLQVYRKVLNGQSAS